MKCEFDNCDQDSGHDGSHGISKAIPGLVFAPYGGGEGHILPPIDSDIPCDSCSGKMVFRKYENGGGEFLCTECDQSHYISSEGGHSCLKTDIYPSNMKEGSKIYDEYLKHRESEFRMLTAMRLESGVIDQEEANSRINEMMDALSTKRHEIEQMKSSKWKRLLAIFF